MYRIGIKHSGSVIAIANLSEEEEKILDERNVEFMIELFEKKFGLDIGEYGLHEYEYFIGNFFILIRSEDLIDLREFKLNKFL